MVDLPGVESGHFSGEVGEAFGDPGRTEDLGKGFGLLVGEPEDLLGLVRIVAGIDDDLEVTGAPGDDADAVAVPVLELVAQTDAGQQYLFDIHAVNTRSAQAPA